MPNIRFDMCVNDYHGYGQHTGRLRAAHFHTADDMDYFIHLECTDRKLICRKLDDKHIRVGKLKCPILGYSTYVGNMMWDSALVTVRVANAIASYLRNSGNYAPDHGTVELWERWDAGEALFVARQPDASEGGDDATS